MGQLMGNGTTNGGMGQLMGEWATNREMGRKRGMGQIMGKWGKYGVIVNYWVNGATNGGMWLK